MKAGERIVRHQDGPYFVESMLVPRHPHRSFHARSEKFLELPESRAWGLFRVLKLRILVVLVFGDDFDTVNSILLLLARAESLAWWRSYFRCNVTLYGCDHHVRSDLRVRCGERGDGLCLRKDDGVLR